MSCFTVEERWRWGDGNNCEGAIGAVREPAAGPLTCNAHGGRAACDGAGLQEKGLQMKSLDLGIIWFAYLFNSCLRI
jgi:hypothetical protein